MEDLHVLVEEQERHGLHQGKPTVWAVLVPCKASQKKDHEPNVSAIFDIHVAGAKIWQNGKFSEYIKNTTFDPALGYPIGGERDEHDTRLDSHTVFNTRAYNPLEHDSYDDVHGDDNDDMGAGALGGGGEYTTGEILL